MRRKLLCIGLIVIVILLSACSAVPQEQQLGQNTSMQKTTIPAFTPPHSSSDAPVDTSPGDKSNQPEQPPAQQTSPTPESNPLLVSKPDRKDPQNDTYSMERTLSDGGQRNTIAFSALAFLTGDICADSFLPPGKVADYFGFQYLRDNTPNGMGHNTDFVTKSANGVLSILTDNQKEQMITLAKNQASLVNEFAYMRFPLMRAFRRQLEGDIPAGSSGLNKEAVMTYSAELYEIDVTISMQRAESFGDIIRSLDPNQRASMDNMVQGEFQSWADLPDQIDKRSLSHDEHVLVMTYASEMFGWYAGSIEADTYFCPERQGDYFGGFYIKDAPAMGNANYTIDESITGNSGENILKALTTTQAKIVTDLVDIQRDALNEIVAKRQAIATELRCYLKEPSINEETVMALGSRYGELDGEISYYYATHFAEVAETLTAEQKVELMKLRNLEDFPCTGAFLYSERINMPDIIDTDFLFGIDNH